MPCIFAHFISYWTVASIYSPNTIRNFVVQTAYGRSSFFHQKPSAPLPAMFCSINKIRRSAWLSFVTKRDDLKIIFDLTLSTWCREWESDSRQNRSDEQKPKIHFAAERCRRMLLCLIEKLRLSFRARSPRRFRIRFNCMCTCLRVSVCERCSVACVWVRSRHNCWLLVVLVLSALLSIVVSVPDKPNTLT